MKFSLVDRIIECNAKDSIKTVKNLTLGEEYLDDHFPGYPVMPGVLMIEAMVQSAGWLVRIITGFSVSLITLCSVSNIKYGKFIVPGDTLELDIKLKSLENGAASFRGKGTVNDVTAVSGQFDIVYRNLADNDKALAPNDKKLILTARKSFSAIGGEAFYVPPVHL